MRVLNADHWQRAGSFAGRLQVMRATWWQPWQQTFRSMRMRDENSEVVAMAEKGESYDVVGKADDSWIKVAAGEDGRLFEGSE